MINLTYSDRGFLHGDFKDNYGRNCSVQESSASAGDEGGYLWLGVSEPVLIADLHNGPGKPYQLPDNVTVFSRMHLSQAKVKELLPILQYFAEHGELPVPAENKQEQHTDMLISGMKKLICNGLLKRFFEVHQFDILDRRLAIRLQAELDDYIKTLSHPLNKVQLKVEYNTMPANRIVVRINGEIFCTFT